MDKFVKKVFLNLMLSVSVLALLWTIPTAAYAQTEEEAEDEQSASASETPSAKADGEETSASVDEDGDEEEERITVTGSRIARSNRTSSVPVTSIDNDFIKRSGSIFLGDQLARLPQLNPTFVQQNSSRFIGTTGGNFNDLRGLGTDRTLTLVNGRRHIGGGALSPVVDVNTIPQDLVERVDILTGGASAVYGADAMAGVVNFIIADRYEGIAVRSQYGVSERGDASNWFVSATVGSNFADDRGNAVIAFEYTRRETFLNTARGFARDLFGFFPNPADMDMDDFNDGVPDFILTPGVGGNTRSDAGLIFVQDPELQGIFTRDGALRPFDFGLTDPEQAVALGAQIGGDTRARGPFSLIPASERINAVALFSYDLTDWARFYSEAKFVLYDSFGGIAGPTFDVDDAELVVRRDNAYLPTRLAALMDNLGLSTVTIGRLNLDLGARDQRVERLTLRAAAGFKGDVNENVSYDVGFTYGNAFVTSANSGNRVNDRFFAATDAVVDRNGEVNGNPGEIVCRASLQRTRGEDVTLPDGSPAKDFAVDDCVPTSIFGEGAVGDAASDSATRVGSLQNTIEQIQLMGFVNLNSGGYFELPGGPISVVLGAEYRVDQATERGDVADNLGLTFFNAFRATRGTIDVGELFGEISFPVIAGLPGIEELTLLAGGRLSRYSLDQVGTILSGSASAAYRPVEDFAVRGSYGLAVRAPNVGDALSAPVQNFGGVGDPCDADNINDDPNRAANCQALAERVGFAGFQPGVTNILDNVSRELLSGGNPQIEEEKSSNWTVGSVFEPRWVPGLVLSADYYTFRIEDAIAQPSAQRIANNCVDGEALNDQFCDLITRSPEDFQITLIENRNLNLNAIENSGVDMQVVYDFPVEEAANLAGFSNVGDLGKIGMQLFLNHLARIRVFPDQNDQEEENVFEGFSGTPQWRGSYTINYDISKIFVTYGFNFVGGFSRFGSREAIENNPDSIQPASVRPKFYHRISAGYQVLDEISVYAGVTNLLNQEPPVPFSGVGGATGFYDNVGRSYFFGTTINY